MKTLFAGLVALVALMGSAQAGSKSVTSIWFGGYGPSSPEERSINLSTAIANFGIQNGTLGLPGHTYITNNNQTAIGTAIDIVNGSGNVNLHADQDANIGTQGNGASSTTNTGDGHFDTGNVLKFD